MISIHREGKKWVTVGLLTYAALAALLFAAHSAFLWPVVVVAGVAFLLIVNFFRNPPRPIPVVDDHLVYAPADGKIVVIETVTEDEYFHKTCKMVSIFMNPLNVHVNRCPFSGTVSYSQYHSGLYLAAWHPKSSLENERNTVVIRRKDGVEVLLRQVAGALARRICSYAVGGKSFQQGDDFGFIKFGSRVDIYLPPQAEVRIQMDQLVKGNVDVIAYLP
ncbi:MAG: phosphatidylserine decarboxylase family protein [Saprospiraceae bacterium]|nr:phosphatidylserine decarboxylase family protein [Saprospiraceae bacterium]MBV6473238.1 Phosphatidylserine decarboxylase proenzyme [Saprospiraceae bacterium]